VLRENELAFKALSKAVDHRDSLPALYADFQFFVARSVFLSYLGRFANLMRRALHFSWNRFSPVHFAC
jgi:hypothetical protein